MTYVLPLNRTGPIENAEFAVGIDPDIDKSGLAVWSRTTKRMRFIKSVEFHELLSLINSIKPGTTDFYVDAGWLNGGYFHALPPNFNTFSEASKRAYLIKRGIDVGRNFGVGQCIVAYLKAHNHPVYEVRPTKHKWSAADLKKFTGWEKRTNSEMRDAASLCFKK